MAHNPSFVARVRNRCEYAVMRAAAWFMGVLPENLSYRTFEFLGEVFVRLSARRRRYAMRFLRNAFPDSTDPGQLDRLARKGCGNLCQVFLDLARVDRMLQSGRFAERIDMSELDDLGLDSRWIGVTGHLGSWECGAIGVAQRGVQTHVTARLMKNPLLQDWLLRSRKQAGLVIHNRRGGIRGIARALEDGNVALQVVDQNQRLRGVFVPFFGELASTERAAATLAIQRGYPVLVAANLRIGSGFRFRFVVQEVIHPEIKGDKHADVRRLVLRINQALEALIRRFPDQYLWIHDRYRTRPPAMA